MYMYTTNPSAHTVYCMCMHLTLLFPANWGLDWKTHKHTHDHCGTHCRILLHSSGSTTISKWATVRDSLVGPKPVIEVGLQHQRNKDMKRIEFELKQPLLQRPSQTHAHTHTRTQARIYTNSRTRHETAKSGVCQNPSTSRLTILILDLIKFPGGWIIGLEVRARGRCDVGWEWVWHDSFESATWRIKGQANSLTIRVQIIGLEVRKRGWSVSVGSLVWEWGWVWHDVVTWIIRMYDKA